ncbi:MAG: response regulator transcription factor [Actinobacteria bacterium]|nr:MAG: response regulator transcription factor [Actinomycetota bacterium]
MGASPDTIGLVVIDPLAMFRAGLRLIIEKEPDLEVVGEAASAEDGMAFLRRRRRRSSLIVLVALELAGTHEAVWLIRSIREAFPILPIMAIGGDAENGAISHGLFAGADGFVHKNSSPKKFLAAIRRLANGETVLEGLPRGALGRIAEDVEGQQAGAANLTARERQILTVAAEGITARQIGRRLGVQERTVTTHLGRIYQKLGTNNRIGAIAAATRSGLLPTGAQS